MLLDRRQFFWSQYLGRNARTLPVGPADVLAREGFEKPRLAMAERPGAPVVRSLGPDIGPRVFVRFVPDARVTEIVALLERYRATVISGGSGGLFRLQLGEQPLQKPEQERLMRRLESEAIVSLVQPAP